MASTGILNATSISQIDRLTGPSWANPNNAIGDDVGTYADCTAGSTYRTTDWIVGNVTHGIGSGATIVGFIASANRRYIPDGSGPCPATMQIVKNGSLVGTPKAISDWPTTLGWSADAGGAADLWGTTATGADSIGIAISGEAPDNHDVMRLYGFRLTIYYTLGDVISPTNSNSNKVVIFG